jgi:hypothetical protein
MKQTRETRQASVVAAWQKWEAPAVRAMLASALALAGRNSIQAVSRGAALHQAGRPLQRLQRQLTPAYLTQGGQAAAMVRAALSVLAPPLLCGSPSLPGLKWLRSDRRLRRLKYAPPQVSPQAGGAGMTARSRHRRRLFGGSTQHRARRPRPSGRPRHSRTGRAPCPYRLGCRGDRPGQTSLEAAPPVVVRLLFTVNLSRIRRQRSPTSDGIRAPGSRRRRPFDRKGGLCAPHAAP